MRRGGMRILMLVMGLVLWTSGCEDTPVDPPVTCTPQCTDKACGDDGCGAPCGTCDADETCGTDFKCAPVSACTPACAGRDCGADGCGGACGTCALGDSCDGGKGLCYDPAACTPECGDAVCGSNGCGGSCGTCAVGTGCESGACVDVCTPDCAGKACGADGCGGSCGFCAAGLNCDIDAGTCYDPTACTPACDGKSCGGDGCGGSCGACAADEECASGACVCAPDCSDRDCGDDGCGGSCGDCNTDGGEVCTDDGDCDVPCVPDCGTTTCGDDGCGGSCGSCPSGYECSVGTCEMGCTPDCDGKTCGDDGCEGTCGSCEGDDECNGDGACYDPSACVGSCDGKSCGDDGCGVTCGVCPDGAECSGGACVALCVPECSDKACGDDGCGESCGSCPGGAECTEGSCVAICVPACSGKTCGDNGCGGVCGICAAGVSCIEDVCDSACVPTCGGKTCGDNGCGGLCGLCTGDELCDATGACVEPSACVPDCTDKECGVDGCGGVCASCAFAEVCNGDFECVYICTPNCGEFTCGTNDGCGGSCGECDAGSLCAAGTCTVGLGDLDCVGFRGCAGACADAACFMNCIVTTSAVGLSDHVDYEACRTNDCPYGELLGTTYACLDENCGAEAGKCIELWPSGTDECAELFACNGACDDTDCQYACIDEATPVALGKLFEIFDCPSNAITTGACPPGGNACINDYCDVAVEKCAGPQACEPDCEGRVCGFDGCGGSCGACPVFGDIESCVAGTCVLPGAVVSNSCVDAIGCFQECTVGDTACLNACGKSLDPETLSTVSTFLTCRAEECAKYATYAGYFTCVAVSCGEFAPECSVYSPVGDADCLATQACWDGCTTGDCPAICSSAAKPEGWGQFLDIFYCYANAVDLEFCEEGDTACAEALCAGVDAECADTSACLPNCGDSTCGDDGCGGTCGTCGAGAICSPTAAGGVACVTGAGDKTCSEYYDCTAACVDAGASCLNACALLTAPSALDESAAYQACGNGPCGGVDIVGYLDQLTCLAETCLDVSLACDGSFPAGDQACVAAFTCATSCPVDTECGTDCRRDATPTGWGLAADYSNCLFGAFGDGTCGPADIPCMMGACGEVFDACVADGTSE